MARATRAIAGIQMKLKMATLAEAAQRTWMMATTTSRPACARGRPRRRSSPRSARSCRAP
eukprot:3984724-Pyramimonas_sp.AAC.1